MPDPWLILASEVPLLDSDGEPWVGRCLVRLPAHDETHTYDCDEPRVYHVTAKEWTGEVLEVHPDGRLTVTTRGHRPWLTRVAPECVVLDARRWPVACLLKRALCAALGWECPLSGLVWIRHSPRSDGLIFWSLRDGEGHEYAYFTSKHWADATTVYGEPITPGISELPDTPEGRATALVMACRAVGK